MNIFQTDYESRLQSWHDLKEETKTLELLEACIKIDDWWQHAGLIQHYLHVHDIHNWPNPWELLVENTYCEIAKALGMCYTLHMIGIKDIKLVQATDIMGYDVVLVLVDNAKYIMNYWPGTVVNNNLQDFSIKKPIEIAPLLQKI